MHGANPINLNRRENLSREQKIGGLQQDLPPDPVAAHRRVSEDTDLTSQERRLAYVEAAATSTEDHHAVIRLEEVVRHVERVEA